MRTMLLLPIAIVGLAILPAQSKPPVTEVRATFERFVAVQNAHDASGLEKLLLDSDSFLWITRGNAVWGSRDALARFATLYQGTWKLEPDMSSFRVVASGSDFAQLFVRVRFTIGAAGQEATQTDFFLNQTLVRAPDGWRIASILPIPVAAK